MDTTKRTYLYVVSAISLLVLAVGLQSLIAYPLRELADSFGATVIGGSGTMGREQLSLAIALVVVGLPVFAIHWMLVGRSWGGTDEAALADRHSVLRAIHLGLVSTVSIAAAMLASIQIVTESLGTAFGVERFGESGLPSAVATVAVALPIWWYHAHRRNLDLRHDHMTGPAAWWTRLHRYAWAFIGLMVLIAGTAGLIETLASVAIGRGDFGTADRWWVGSIVASVASIAVGLAVFWIHADDARRAIRDSAIIGEDDRDTASRATYFGAVLLVTLAFVSLAVASSITGFGRWIGGLEEATGLPDFLEIVIGPLLVAVPYVVAGWTHRLAQRREAAGRSAAALVTVDRLSLHLAAGVGLAFLAVGACQLLGRFLEMALDARTADDFLRGEIVSSIANILIGAVLWLPAWVLVLRHRAADPVTERRAVVGRAYLFLVVGSALIAAVPSGVFTLSRIIEVALGGGSGSATDVAIPFAVVVVASVVAAYHGRLVIGDMRTVAQEERAATAEAALERGPADEVPVAIAAVSLTLTLRGPAGVDLAQVANGMRERLPAGVILVESA